MEVLSLNVYRTVEFKLLESVVMVVDKALESEQCEQFNDGGLDFCLRKLQTK